MKVRVGPYDGISNTTYHRRCFSPGQRRWWLRNQDGSFVSLPPIRGDEDFNMELELDPGSYVLGTGPTGRHGVRYKIVVKRG